MRERPQQPPDHLPEQCLHADDHGGASIRDRLPSDPPTKSRARGRVINLQQ